MSEQLPKELSAILSPLLAVRFELLQTSTDHHNMRKYAMRFEFPLKASLRPLPAATIVARHTRAQLE
jgi:hypothetical protein